MRPIRLLLPAVLAVLSLPPTAAAAAADRGSFPFASGSHRMTAWYHRPSGLPADAPVLFVIHGVGRNAEEYLEDWAELADQRRFLLVAPEFSRAEYPGEESFNSGNLFDAAGRPQPREQWSYSAIEVLFDLLPARLGTSRRDYLIYGHSAGAQFVQRFLYFVPEARVTRAVAANAGWYMLPDPATPFPYGLRGTVADESALRTALARPVVVLLGEADTDPGHRSLRHTPEADAQGPHRLARGRHFFARAQAEADRLHVALGWTLATVPGVEHSNKGMAPFAARHLFPE